MKTRRETTLVIGGTGKTGRRVAQRLEERGVPVRIGSRSGDPPFDWTDRGTWGPALRGARAAYVTYYPDLALPGAAAEVAELAALAMKSGVRRLVLLSGRGEEGARLGEKAVQDSGADWTVVRSAFFSQNFSEGFLVDQVRSGEVAFPAEGVKEPFVDLEDVADVAAAALTDDRHVGQVYEVTGPRLLTFAEATEEVARAAGRTLRYVPVSPEEYRALLARLEVPADVIALLLQVFSEVLDGRNARLTDGVERALGRPPRDFAEYARAEAAAGVWAQAS